MSRNLIDTNLIIRFLVNDSPQKASRVERLLKDSRNTNILLDTIIAEIIWVLSSYYELTKPRVVELVRSLIHVDSVECNDYLLNRVLTIWQENNISYIDAYLAGVAELGKIPVYSYDIKFKRVPSIIVKEP